MTTHDPSLCSICDRVPRQSEPFPGVQYNVLSSAVPDFDQEYVYSYTQV